MLTDKHNNNKRHLLAQSDYQVWKTHPVTKALIESLQNLQQLEALTHLKKTNPSRKTPDQIALETAFQAGRQSILERFADFEILKETFLTDVNIDWEK